MAGSIARRSTAASSEDHMSLRVLAAGNAESQTVAFQVLGYKEDDPNIRCGYTLPQRGNAQVISALSSPDKFEYTSDYTIRQVATAAAKIAADLVMTAGFGSPVAYQKSGNFMTSASKRGMVLIPRFAEVAARNGFSLDADGQRVYHTGWSLAKDAADEMARTAAAAAAQFSPSLHMVAYRVNAPDIQMAGT